MKFFSCNFVVVVAIFTALHRIPEVNAADSHPIIIQDEVINDPENLIFKPKLGFTCKDWPGSEELSWFRKFFTHHRYSISDTVCRIHAQVRYQEVLHWPTGSENFSKIRFKKKSYIIS